MRKGRLLLLLVFSLPSSARLQTYWQRMADSLDLGYYACRTTDPIKVDGLLTEDTWRYAQKAANFIQNFPNDSLLASARSEVMVAYDDRYIHFAARMYSTKPGKGYVTPSLKRDFRGEANDAIVISIDPFMDRLNAFSFGVNPFGVQREGLVVNGGVAGEDLSLSWDNKWISEAKIHEDHWSMEMSIPLSTLRFRNGAQKWLINFYRIDSQNGERAGWARVPNQYAMVSLAFSKPLEFETPIRRRGPNISLIPFASPSVLRTPIKNPADARRYALEPRFGFGGDAKVGIGSSLNVDLTFNPDFSQVEVDNQVTNLDRFEILFPEKRQFFLENGDLFANFGTESIRPFFSRRIGLTVDPGTGQNIQNKIDAGMRLSGKLDDKTRLGLLQMRTAAIDSIGQPANDFTVFAMQRKLFSRSGFGVIFTNKEAAGSKDFNRVAGFDYIIGSKNNVWNGKLFWMKSFDSQPTRKDQAFGGNIVYNTRKVESRHRLSRIGEEFNPEVGYLRRRGFWKYAGDYQLKYYPASTSKVNRHGPMLDYDFTLFPGKGLTDYDLNLIYNVLWRNFTTLLVRFRRDFTMLTEDFDPTNTGGTRLKAGDAFVYHSFICSLSTDQRRRVAAKLGTRSGQYFNGSRINLDGEVNYRMQPYGSIGTVFSYNRLRFPDPYKSLNLVLLGPKLDITFTRSVFFSALVQYNSQIRNINTNLRFQWRFAPASDLFLVYTDNYFSDSFRSKGGALVMKMTYWMNL